MALATLTKTRGVLAVTAAAGALLGALAGPARAAAPEPPAGNWLRVSVMQGDGPTGDVRHALLRCPADENAAVNAAEGAGTGRSGGERACRELAAAGGDIAAIPVADTACTMVYRPVTAYAFGMWNGRRVVYAHNFANACALHASTGSVFTFDQ
ncbi:SSI family serine proteinase inhibitor [Streptomyces sp. NPDC050400]|uniref:SSI family serine proteinase inhibitor n=1 Tax=Streptomyces sp. NPDC050400 TaxID=3365610 RepID=UPI0037989E68